MSANGLFEHFVNTRAYRPTERDRALIQRLTELVRQSLPGSQVRWAGSQHKGTAVAGSDLDFVVETAQPVTEAQRRELRTRLETGLGRAAVIRSHVVRLPATGVDPKADLSFANAAFGSRPLPDRSAFHDQRSRQAAVRAFKLWTRAGGFPPVPGWAVEGLVLHLDTPQSDRAPLELFLRVTSWLADSASGPAVEGALRPLAFPLWNEAWSKTLPGRVEALRNGARALAGRRPGPPEWRSEADVERWLGR